jgi:serine/threonine-protein kinase
MGLLAYRVLTGVLPVWPFDWPPAGYAVLRRKAHPDLITVLRKSLEMRPSRRYRDASEMLRAYRVAKRRALRKYQR